MSSIRFESLKQYDVVANPSARSRNVKPYLVLLQSRFLDYLPTRIVAPLVPQSAYFPNKRLSPSFIVGGRELMFTPTDIAVVPLSAFGRRVTSLASEYLKITDALDIALSSA